MGAHWHHHFLRQTDYQIWANQVLFDSLARLHADALQAPEGLQESTMVDVHTHLMTHFVHHRGQVSAVATRLGAPAAEMDFVYFVRAMERATREVQVAQQQQ
jgi:uncharacterized damage-inducible protein DinB